MATKGDALMNSRDGSNDGLPQRKPPRGVFSKRCLVDTLKINHFRVIFGLMMKAQCFRKALPPKRCFFWNIHVFSKRWLLDAVKIINFRLIFGFMVEDDQWIWWRFSALKNYRNSLPIDERYFVYTLKNFSKICLEDFVTNITLRQFIDSLSFYEARI